jgi:hypothetical protein
LSYVAAVVVEERIIFPAFGEKKRKAEIIYARKIFIAFSLARWKLQSLTISRP